MSKTPPFRAEHVGSLLRPKELTQAFRAHSEGSLDQAGFTEIQDRAIRDVVALQEEAGLRLVTDGEFRRPSYWAHFVNRVDGLTIRQARFRFRDDHGDETDFTAPHVEAKVRRTRGISTDEFAFLDKVATAMPKITLPSPSTMHFWRGAEGIDPGAYGDAEAYFDDLAAVYQTEITALADMGARYLQIDEVPLAMLCDTEVRNRLATSGEDPDELTDAYVRLTNQALAGRPDSVTVGMHLCRGNFKGRYLSEGGYEAVAERLFNDINVDAFFLEYDTPRAGDFAPLRQVPADKSVVLGLVSSKLPELEPVDQLRARIDEAARFIDLERLGLSPQCGFASTVAGNPVTIDDQKAKLSLVVETANLVWGEA